MPQRKLDRYVSLVNMACDAIMLLVSAWAAYSCRFLLPLIPVRGDSPEWTTYARALMVMIPVYFIYLRAYGLYDGRRHIRRIEQIFLVTKAATFSVMTLMAVTFFYRDFSYSRIYLIFLWVLSVICLGTCRYLLIQWQYGIKIKSKHKTRVLLIGANRSARQIIQWAANNPHYGYEIMGVLARDSALKEKHFEGIPVIGTIQDCEKMIQEMNPDQVTLVDHSFSRERVSDIVALCEDRFINFKISVDIYGLITRNVDVEYVSSIPLLGFRSLPLDHWENRAVKRCFDLLVSAVVLILTSPIWIAVALIVKLDSPGPVFFRQKRMGRDQRVFNVLKFRTMKQDAEKETGPVWAKAEDDRRTRSGALLRKWNLDELPQLFNVLRGDMSLVGPRPERPHFIEQFREQIPRYMARHKIKSGLTGWAQVNGYRGNTSIEERLKYDLYYMENWSLLFDVEIMVMTVFAFKNAY